MTQRKSDDVPPRKQRAAWDGDPPERAAARERLLEIAAKCVARNGIPATGIAHVALEAGVSRPTVYRYFKDRQELIRSVLLQAGLRMANEVREHIQTEPSPGGKVVEAAIFTLRAVRENPVLRQVWVPPMFDSRALQGFTQPASIMFTRVALPEIIAAAGWDDEDANEAMEVILRIILSLLASPEPERSEQELREFLNRRLVPALGL